MINNRYEMFFGSWYNLENGSGVYAIVNSLNNKKYIGSTGNLRRRFRQHYANLTRNTHDNCHLQNAVNKYGIDKFYFIVLERCENIVSTLLLIEQKYIDELGDYNICVEAGRITGVTPIGHELSSQQRESIIRANKERVWTEQMRNKHSKSLKRSLHTITKQKKVDKFDLDGTYICTYPSIMDAARDINVQKYKSVRVGIKRCYQGKYNSAYGFIWKLNKQKNDDK